LFDRTGEENLDEKSKRKGKLFAELNKVAKEKKGGSGKGFEN
jgi:hypothetical protein